MKTEKWDRTEFSPYRKTDIDTGTNELNLNHTLPISSPVSKPGTILTTMTNLSQSDITAAQKCRERFSPRSATNNSEREKSVERIRKDWCDEDSTAGISSLNTPKNDSSVAHMEANISSSTTSNLKKSDNHSPFRLEVRRGPRKIYQLPIACRLTVQRTEACRCQAFCAPFTQQSEFHSKHRQQWCEIGSAKRHP